jgi:hypothetical protein
MKFRFGRREPTQLDPNADYVLDNGACLQLITTDKGKMKWETWAHRGNFTLSKKSFTSLVKRNLIYLEKEDGHLKYYFFSKEIEGIDEVV